MAEEMQLIWSYKMICYGDKKSGLDHLGFIVIF